MQSVRMRWQKALQLSAVLTALGAGCAAEDPPTPHPNDLRISEEVFRLFCMRVARDEYPSSPDGKEFDAACNGRGMAAVPVPMPRFTALMSRRPQLLTALDQVFAESTGAQVPDVAKFADNELHSFLASLIPFYDDGTLPNSTRALSSVAGKLLEEEPRSRKVLETFARLSPRVGYRASADVVAAVRPMLRYQRLDQLSQELLGFVGKGGQGHDEFMKVLQAVALELAEPGEVVADADADNTTLHTVTQLLFDTDPLLAATADPKTSAYAAPTDPEKYFVVRDIFGNGVGGGAMSRVPPFFMLDRADPQGVARDQFSRAVAANGAPLYEYRDANRTLLAALMRDQKPLLERVNGQKAAVENLLRGVRVILGGDTQRTEEFRTNANGAKATLTFQGPAVETGPMIDLVHALTNTLRYPETQRLVKLLKELLSKHENEAAAPVFAGLAIDKRADDPKHKDVGFMGVDGQLGGPHEFWDDLIDVGMKIAAKPGFIKDIVNEFATPQGSAQARLLARFMKFNDEITYNGAPLSIGADGKYAQADADKMNTLVTWELKRPVVRTPGSDVGMNRSLFQRLMSTIQATNGVPNCNKQGAILNANDPLTGLPLVFPNPAGQPNASLAAPVANLACPAPATALTYDACKFVKQPNGAETHMRAIIGKSKVTIKESQLLCLEKAGLAGNLGETQEKSSQIKGFQFTLTPESVARFMYAPRNKFVSDLFDPLPTKHGEILTSYEPNFLFALEVKDSVVKIDNAGQSFLDVSKGLTGVFDKYQEFETGEDGEVGKGGYLFADLLSILHNHWSSRKATLCGTMAANAACTALKLTGTQCSAGCTQSADFKKPYWSPQSNLVSYEPLLIESLEDERLADLLALSTKTLQTLNITCEDGKQRDGVTILSEFLERMLKPEKDLAYFSEPTRKHARTNTCGPVDEKDSKGAPQCSCPAGSTPVDAKPESGCKLASGAVVPRGRIIAQTTPFHLLLDALNRFDAAFKADNVKDRLDPWRAARSVLVDQFLTVTKTPNAMAPMDATKAKYTMANPRARAVGVKLLGWLDARLDFYRCKGKAPCTTGDAKALEDWAKGLPGRLASTLGHPLVGRGLDLFDKLWATDPAAAEMASFNSYLLDPANAEVFAGVVLAAVDTLSVVDRDRELSPAIQFAALTLAENAFQALDNPTAVAADVENGTAARALEVTRKVADLNRGNPAPSVISRLLKNAVLAAPNARSPLEVIIDAVADVNRFDVAKTTVDPHTYEDNKKVFDQLKFFLSDPDRGLERLYSVIGNRSVKKVPN